MGKQWISGMPPGVKPVKLLVVGPTDYTDRDRVWQELDDYTVRMEAVDVLTLGGPKLVWHAGDQVEVGVAGFAYRWAEREWWPRVTADPKDWGSGPKGLDKALDDLLKIVTAHSGRVLGFWDGEDVETANVLERARAAVPARRFDWRRC